MRRWQYRLLSAIWWLPWRRRLASWIMGVECRAYHVTGKGVLVVFDGWSTTLHGPWDWRRN